MKLNLNNQNSKLFMHYFVIRCFAKATSFISFVQFTFLFQIFDTRGQYFRDVVVI